MKKATRTTIAAPFVGRLRPLAWVLLLTGTAAGGCSCGDDEVSPNQIIPPQDGGGGAAAEVPLSVVTQVANSIEYLTPFDAVPSADGAVVYFTALGPNGPGAFSIPAGGGDAVTLTESFVAPFGIALGTEGKLLYITDPGYETTDPETDFGGIFSLEAEGGEPVLLAMETGIIPHSLEVMADENGIDQIYFTGRDVDGEPGVFKIPAIGGATTTIAKGRPFTDPAGIAVAPTGEIYVMDTLASSRSLGSIMKVTEGMIEEFIPHITIGYPAGIALSLGGQTLIVSAIDPTDGYSVILQYDLVSKEPVGFPVDAQFDGFFEPAGLHRARNANIFSFVDSRANDTGTVFLLQ